MAWRDVPVRPDCLGATSRAVMPLFRQLVRHRPGRRDRASTSTARRSSSASASSTSWNPRSSPTSRRCRRAPSSTRACSRRRSCRRSSPTCPTSASRAPCCSCTAASRPTRSRRGRWPTRTATSPTTARSTRSRATRTGCAPARRCSTTRCCRACERAFPICTPGASDTARFDEVLELLHLGGRPIHHAVLMMIPEAWENNAEMDPAQRAFYRFHASVMEPWDGPASVTFTDGTVIGAVLDRNGLRPSRYWVTDDDLVVMASEVGVIDIDPAKVVTKGRLQPGRMFLIDTAEGRIVDDEEIKTTLAAEHPYGEWLEESLVELADLPEREHVVFSHDSVLRRQQLFGYTHEELKVIVAPMALRGVEPIGSMGTDTPIAVLSDRAAPAVRLLRPALRAGHQPAARRHPRGGRHVGVVDDRAGGRPAAAEPGELPAARAAVPDHRQRRAVEDRPRQRRRPLPRPAVARRQGPVPRRRRRAGARAGLVGHLQRGVVGHRRRRPDHRAVGPQRRRRRGADPVAAADRRRAPPPRAHEAAHDGRPARRVRRRPRGPPHGPADRLRRRGDQPVPGVRVDRGPHRRADARPRRHRRRRRRCATTSRRAARACSR